MNEIDYQQRLAVTKAVKKFRRGRMNRRNFINLCTQAGFGFSSLHFLNACGSQTAPKFELAPAHTTSSQPVIVPGTDQYNFLKEVGKYFAGTTLRVISEDTPPSKSALGLTKEFTKLTGVNVEWDLLPLDGVLARVSQATAREAGTYDIFYLDQAWISRFIDDCVNPGDLLEKKDLAYPSYDFNDILKPLVENIATYKGQLVGIPFDIPIFIMMYRQDIFDELKLPVPTTMDEYLEVVKVINEAKAPEVYGTTGMWLPGHNALHSHMTAWLWSHGGSIFGADERPTINDERAIDGVKYMLELGKYMPPEVMTWDWTLEAQSFAQGRVGIYISWGEYFPGFDDPGTSKIVGLSEAANCPQEIALRSKDECGFGEVPGICRQGGSNLAISRYSKNQKASWIFLQWVTSSDVSTHTLLETGATGIRKSNYHKAKQQAVGARMTRYLDVTLDAISNRMGTDPRLPVASLSGDSFPVELGKLMTNQQDIKTTLDNMTKAAEEAVKQAKQM